MTKQTKDGWIRHRGGKCPVDAGVMVDVRYRDGFERFKTSAIESPDCEEEHWIHEANKSSVLASCDIMAYRVCDPVVEPAVEPAVVANVEAFNAQAEMTGPYIVVNDFPFQQAIENGPLQWRDRITQIDADIKFEEERHCSNMACMDQERIDLVAKLAAEGFALIAPVVEPVEDMSDWRNWKAGDTVTVVIENDADLKIGSNHTIRSVENHRYDGAMPVSVWTDGGDWTWPEAQDEQTRCVFKFHSRPTN